MNLCVPVLEKRGLESRVSAHFASAPAFVIVDTDSGSCRSVTSAGRQHAASAYQPFAALAGERVDGIVVNGIGMGALAKLQAAGILVFRCDEATVGEALAAFAAGTLQPLAPEAVCAGRHPAEA